MTVYDPKGEGVATEKLRGVLDLIGGGRPLGDRVAGYDRNKDGMVTYDEV